MSATGQKFFHCNNMCSLNLRHKPLSAVHSIRGRPIMVQSIICEHLRGMDLAINRLTTELDSEMPLDGRALVYFYVKDLRFNFIFIKSIERWIDENFSWSEIDVKNIRGRYTGWQRVDCCVVSGCEVIDELKRIAQRPALGPHFCGRILFVFRFEGRLQEERIVSVFWQSFVLYFLKSWHSTGVQTTNSHTNFYLIDPF